MTKTETNVVSNQVHVDTTTHSNENLAMSSQEKWITSGASRLKARQNRGFIFRAKQKASSLASNVMYTTLQQARGRSQGQQPKRRRIVGKSLQDANEIGDASVLNVPLMLCAPGLLRRGRHWWLILKMGCCKN